MNSSIIRQAGSNAGSLSVARLGADPNGPEKMKQSSSADGGCLKMSLHAS
jgi:hypothetical protein